MNFLPYIVVKISLTKMWKEKGHIQGRINRRMPVLNPIVNVILKSLSMDIQNINIIS